MKKKAAAALAARIYKLVVTESESLEEDNLGAALAYLMGAILGVSTHVDVIIPQLLRRHLDEDDDVFHFFRRIETIGGVEVRMSSEN
jgi:hypothetical protein